MKIKNLLYDFTCQYIYVNSKMNLAFANTARAQDQEYCVYLSEWRSVYE